MPALSVGPPLEPGADDARRLLIDELSRPEYQAAQPTWFDRLSQSVFEWLGALGGGGGEQGWVVALLVGALLVGLIVLAVVLAGAPRRRGRSRLGGALFGEPERRSPAALRRSAQAAAAAGEWALAVTERFRAIALDLDARTLVRLQPGTTAHGMAEQAAAAFAEHAVALAAAAERFDAVRYLDDEADRADYESLTALDAALRQARPVPVPA